jgi:hypothetical protein
MRRWLPQGDQLIATSGVVYNNDMDYGGIIVKRGEQIIRMAVQGEVGRPPHRDRPADCSPPVAAPERSVLTEMPPTPHPCSPSRRCLPPSAPTQATYP